MWVLGRHAGSVNTRSPAGGRMSRTATPWRPYGNKIAWGAGRGAEVTRLSPQGAHTGDGKATLRGGHVGGRPGRRLHACPPWVNSSSCALLLWVLFCARTGPQQRRLPTCTRGSPSRASSRAAASSDSRDSRSPENSSRRPGTPTERRVLDAPAPEPVPRLHRTWTRCALRSSRSGGAPGGREGVGDPTSTSPPSLPSSTCCQCLLNHRSLNNAETTQQKREKKEKRKAPLTGSSSLFYLFYF